MFIQIIIIIWIQKKLNSIDIEIVDKIHAALLW